MINNTNVSKKDKTIALILCIFGGFLGLHVFYVGKIKKGILYLFTCGLFGIGWLIDIFLIATNSYKDKTGAILSPKVITPVQYTTQNPTINNINNNINNNVNSNINSNVTTTNNFVPPVEREETVTINDNSIPIVDASGNTTYLSYTDKIDVNNCLISDGGKTYHTHVGCYKNWPQEYQTNFKGWKKISIADADNLGYRKCNFCDEKDKPSTETYEDLWDTYQDESPVKTFSVTVPDEFATTSDYNIGEEVNEDYDYEKDKTVLEINYQTINMPKSAKDFFEENTDTYRMFILDVTETDSFKVKLKIGIFEEI